MSRLKGVFLPVEGLEAIRLADAEGMVQKTAPDLLIVDETLEDMDGLTLVRKMLGIYCLQMGRQSPCGWPRRLHGTFFFDFGTAGIACAESPANT